MKLAGQELTFIYKTTGLHVPLYGCEICFLIQNFKFSWLLKGVKSSRSTSYVSSGSRSNCRRLSLSLPEERWTSAPKCCSFTSGNIFSCCVILREERVLKVMEKMTLKRVSEPVRVRKAPVILYSITTTVDIILHLDLRILLETLLNITNIVEYNCASVLLE